MKWWNVSPAWNVLESIVALGDLRNLLVVAHQRILHCVVDPLLLGVRAPGMLLSVLLVSHCDLHHLRSSHGCLGQQRQEEKRDRRRHTWPRGGSYAKGWDLCLQPRPSLAHTCTPLPPVCPLLSCQLTNKGTCGGCHSKEEEVLEPIKTHKQSWSSIFSSSQPVWSCTGIRKSFCLSTNYAAQCITREKQGLGSNFIDCVLLLYPT